MGPRDGDISFCIGCGRFAVFDQAAPGGARKPSAKEAAVISADTDCYQITVAWSAGKQVHHP